MGENRQDLLVADYEKFLKQQSELTRQFLAGKLTTDQIQTFIEGRNPFDPSVAARTVNLVRAKQILGKANIMGPEEIRKAFGITLAPEEIPDIPFSCEELKNAKRLNQFLVLRISWLADKKATTIQNLHNLCQPKLTEHKNGKVLCDINWYKNEEFYTTAAPRSGWYLVDRNPTEGKNKNFLEQTKLIVKYLAKEIFTDQLPPEFQTAITEFEQSVAQIEELMKVNWQAAAKRLADLSINQLCRRRPVEVVYDFLIVFLNNKERLLEKYYDWTPSLDADGDLVGVGSGGVGGLDVDSGGPGRYDSDLGWCLSWSRKMEIENL